jgi:hypothetical protein
MNLRRVTGWSGLVSVVLVVLPALICGTPPASDASAAEFLSFAHGHRGRLFLLTAMTGLGFAASLVFLAGLRAILADPLPAYDLWARAGLALGIAVFVLGAAGMAILATLAYRVGELSADSARLLWDMYTGLVYMSNVVTVPMAIAIAIATFVTGAMHRWAAWLTIAVAVAHAISCCAWAKSGALSPSGGFAQLGAGFYVVWLIALSIALLRSASAATDSGRAAPAVATT